MTAIGSSTGRKDCATESCHRGVSFNLPAYSCYLCPCGVRYQPNQICCVRWPCLNACKLCVKSTAASSDDGNQAAVLVERAVRDFCHLLLGQGCAVLEMCL